MRIPDETLRYAAEFSERYITDRFLPDKAIDLLDEAAARRALDTPELGKRRAAEEEIRRGARRVLSEYEDEVAYAVLYGSYAAGKAKRDSDVNLLICTRVTGLRLADMKARLEDVLRKRVSLLERKALLFPDAPLDEILMHGVRVY